MGTNCELWNHVKPAQILALGRNHWRVDNDCFNSLDLQWREDSGIWCRKGNAVWALGLLRLMAYNLVHMLRLWCRRPWRKTQDGDYAKLLIWRSLFKAIMLTFGTALDSQLPPLAVD